MAIRGLLFDKDGTLFDFQATWGGWAADLVEDLAAGAPAGADDLARRIRLDLAARRFHPDSPVIAGTGAEAVALLAAGLPDRPRAEIAALMERRARALSPVPAVPLAPLLGRLRGAGLVLGVATNDGEAAARAQLAEAGAGDAFVFVAGADSGHGAKPAPGMAEAFLAETGLAREEVALIGDSLHDAETGRRAGLVTLGVLSGPAGAEDLAPHVAEVLPHIGHLPRWLGLG